MILNSVVKHISSEQFQFNLSQMFESTDKDLLDKPFVLYRSDILNDYNLFTMGLWRYDLPEITFPSTAPHDKSVIETIIHNVKFVLDRYKDTDVEDINLSELESLLTLACGETVNIRIKDTEEFFWGHGMPYRFYLGDVYKNILVLEITYGEV